LKTGARLRSFAADVASGLRTGLIPTLLMFLLVPLSVVYGLVMVCRNALYRLRILRSSSLPRPVISVGNLTTGGTGKTPFVEMLARWLKADRHRPALLSRGYATPPGATMNDEARLLARRAVELPHFCGKDRLAQGRKAIADAEADCLILDDGFQHRRLRRDLDLVLIDALIPFGNRQLLPAGTLREPVDSLRRADAIVLTRVGAGPPERVESIRRSLAKVAPSVPVFEADHAPVAWRCGQESHPPEWIDGKSVLTFCGLGNPRGFEETVRHLGARIVATRRFPDHYWYEDADLEALTDAATEAGAERLVTTEKDAARLPAGGHEETVCVLEIEMQMRQGEAELRQLLHRTLRDEP